MNVTEFDLGAQRLVAHVAAHLGAADPVAIDDCVVDAFRRIAEVIPIDLACVCGRTGDGSAAAISHTWTRAQTAAFPRELPIRALPWVVSTLEAGGTVRFGASDEIPAERDRERLEQIGIRSGLFIPVEPEGERIDRDLTVVCFAAIGRAQPWTDATVECLQMIAGSVGQAFGRRASRAALQTALEDIKHLRDRLDGENRELRREMQTLRSPGVIISESLAMNRALASAQQVAPTPATVLLLGETGVGKEVLAKAIHDMSPRHHRPMVRVSCAAIPTALIESELFGRERGAYTGALSRQIGRFEAADGSTLFLDEIGDLPMEVQVKLLRVLQDRVIERLGSTQSIKVDVRIIAATNRNLEEAVQNKTFREDLYYRLDVFPITVPPLRERLEDLPGLVWSFVDEFSRMFGKVIESIPKESMEELQRYPWPGNVRELRNVIERAVILSTGRNLILSAPRAPSRLPQTAMTLSALEVEHIRGVLDSTHWRIRGHGGAAERLGLKPTTLESRMTRLGITRKKVSPA